MKSKPYIKARINDVDILYRYAYFPTEVQNADGTHQTIWLEYFWERRVYWESISIGITYFKDRYSFNPENPWTAVTI